MKPARSSLLNMILALVGTALVTAAALAIVHQITEKTIQHQAQRTLAEGIKNVMHTPEMKIAETKNVVCSVDGKVTNFVVHNVQDGSGKPVGAAVESSVMGFGGELRVLVGFSTTENILGYQILQTSETPGLGAKADKWFQQGGKGNIIGKHPGKHPLRVRKDGGEVDAITASTITSRAFLQAINHAYVAFSQKKHTLHGEMSNRK